MKKLHTLLATVSMFTLVGAGCGAAPEPPATNTAPSPSAESAASSPSRIAGSCNHPYYPLQVGKKIEYQSSISGRTHRWTFTVKEVNADSAKIEYTFENGGSVEMDLSCTPDGIRALSHVDFSAAMGGQTLAKATTKSAVGELLPANFRVGSEWTNEFETEAEITNPVMRQAGVTNVNSAMKMDHKVIGEESVTVPAGTFTALKVETTMKMKSMMGTVATPIETTVVSTEYWVEGVGLVKSMNGEGATAWTMEATSVTR